MKTHVNEPRPLACPANVVTSLLAAIKAGREKRRRQRMVQRDYERLLGYEDYLLRDVGLDPAEVVGWRRLRNPPSQGGW